MPLAGRFKFRTGGSEQLVSILARGFQHTKARFGSLLFRLMQQVVIDERGHLLEDVSGSLAWLIARGGTNGLSGLQGPAPREDGEVAEDPLLSRGQQGIGPSQRISQRLLADRGIL